MKKKTVFYSLFLMFGIAFSAVGQIQMNTDSKVEKGIQENFLLKTVGENSNGAELIVVSNTKNKLQNEL